MLRSALFALALMAGVSGAALGQTTAAASPKATALPDANGVENGMLPPVLQQSRTFPIPMQRANKGREQEVFQVFESTVAPEAKLAVNATPTKSLIAGYFSQSFRAAELEELTRFFSSPPGKKFSEKGALTSGHLPNLALALVGSGTVQGGVQAAVHEIERRGMTIPGPPRAN